MGLSVLLGSDSSPLWNGLFGSSDEGGYCCGWAGLNAIQHDSADRKDAALVSRAAGPVTGLAGLQSDQTHSAQQQISDRQDQQQPIQTLRAGYLCIPQTPSIAFVLVIPEQFLNRHALAIKLADLCRPCVQIGHKEPA